MRKLIAVTVILSGALPVTTGSNAFAQDRGTKSSATLKAAELPSAEKIIDDYVTAIGGSEALLKFKTRRSEGTLEMAALGINGKVMLLQSSPNKFLMAIDIPGIGSIKNGCDGEQVWESSVIAGNRVLEGSEREQMLRRTRMGAEASWREDYPIVKTTGEAKIGDRPVWVVELTPKQTGSDAKESVQTDYYDKETKLLLRTTMTVSSPMGEIEVESSFSDYRDVDGVKLPFESTQSVLGQEQVMRLTKVIHNSEIDAKEFTSP